MINVGEQLVASYLRFIRNCEFTQVNLYTVQAQGEIDVIGIDLNQKRLYVCEVAVHLSTGLQYVKNNRPNNIEKLTSKFSRDIDYANEYFPDYEKHFMLWSPIVKAKLGSQYNQMEHIKQIDSNIRASHDVEIEFVINEKFQQCMGEMRTYAATQTAELKCPLMRLMQIETQLGTHVAKLNS